MMAGKDLETLVHLIKEVRMGVLKENVHGELGKVQSECYDLLGEILGEVVLRKD